MKKSVIVMIAVAALMGFSIIIGCKEDGNKSAAQVPPMSPFPQASQFSQAPPMEGGHTGKVIDTMDSGGYTYVQVDTGSQKIWAAANQFDVKLGDQVTVPPGAPMQNFHSKTLDRTFDLVYFVSHVSVAGANEGGGDMPPGHPGMGQALAPPGMGASQPMGHQTPAPPADVDLSGIEKAEGGKTVAEIYGGKAELADKPVVVRGKVVKFNAAIMGKNWIHLRDGSGDEGRNDLTVTTDVTANVGDTVTVSGVITLDKDFGAGYFYDVVIENAVVTVEGPATKP